MWNKRTLHGKISPCTACATSRSQWLQRTGQKNNRDTNHGSTGSTEAEVDQTMVQHIIAECKMQTGKADTWLEQWTRTSELRVDWSFYSQSWDFKCVWEQAQVLWVFQIQTDSQADFCRVELDIFMQVCAIMKAFNLIHKQLIDFEFLIVDFRVNLVTHQGLLVFSYSSWCSLGYTPRLNHKTCISTSFFFTWWNTIWFLSS